MLNVIMLNVVMLSVVAPKLRHKVSLHLRYKLNIKCNTKDIDECRYAMFCYTECCVCLVLELSQLWWVHCDTERSAAFLLQN